VEQKSDRPEIAKWLSQIEGVRAEAKRMRAERTPDELSWKPSPSSWSVSEVFDHLRSTNEQYFPKIEASLSAKGRTERDSYARTWFGRWFIGLVEPDSTRKLKAPSKFTPEHATLGVDAIDTFIATQSKLEEFMRAAENVELGRKKIGSPITPLIRFTLGEIFDLLATHQRRHLEQAQRVEQSAQMPEEPRRTP